MALQLVIQQSTLIYQYISILADLNHYLYLGFVKNETATNLTRKMFFQIQAFDEWNQGELESFLIEITSNILKFRDTDGSFLVDKIRDSAGQVCNLLQTLLLSKNCLALLLFAF